MLAPENYPGRMNDIPFVGDIVRIISLILGDCVKGSEIDAKDMCACVCACVLSWSETK